MSDRDEDVLVHELAKLGELGGLAGGGHMGAIGGAIGVGWAANRLPSTSAARTVHLQVPAGDAVRSAFKAVTKVGRLLGGNVEQATPTFRGVVGSGFLDMNPAVVEVTIEPVSANQTAIHIRATAKEGLIKQGTSEKAIKKVLAAAGWES